MEYKYIYNKTNKTEVRNILIEYGLITLVMGVVSVLFLFAFFRALDIRLANQNEMLCESSKVSGNEDMVRFKCVTGGTNDVK